MTPHHTESGADERRVQALLRRLGVGPDAEPVTLPDVPPSLPDGFEPRTRDWLDDILDGNADQPTPRPKRAPRRAMETEPTAEPRERRDWSWLWQWLRPWQTFTAGAVSVLPLFNGWSPATGWALVLHDMRADTLAGAYTTAGIVLGATYLLDLRRRRWLTRLALITTAIGTLGVLDLFDPITFATGVHR
ncbi:hypothetical protein [Streptomyces sp. NBC_00483]|uniref:hypothetical protein n=1 Tax=Streptomyces sp. NBC_00483 TaxID=2975756 RepID=UPI002E1825DE